MATLRIRSLVAGCAIFAAFAVQAAEVVDKAQASLYERLGGKPAINAVVDSLWRRIVADSRVNAWFQQTALDAERATAYRSKLATLLCQATGGPCHYTGDMVAAHKGRAVTAEAFDAVMEDVTATLDELKVPNKEKNEVVGLLSPLKAVVVQK